MPRRPVCFTPRHRHLGWWLCPVCMRLCTAGGMGMTVLQGVMNAGTTGQVVLSTGGVGGIVGTTVGRTGDKMVGKMVGTTGVAERPRPLSMRL